MTEWLQLLHEIPVDTVSLLEGPPDSSCCVRNQHVFLQSFTGQPDRRVQRDVQPDVQRDVHPDVLQHREDADLLMDPRL